MIRTSNEEPAHPPAWAESVLRAFLEPRSRDTISGDLFEEYSEVVLPARGDLGAKLWYIRQVASFVTVGGLIHISFAGLKENTMFDRAARSSWLWFAAGSVALLALLGTLVRSNFGPPASLAVLIVISIVVGAAALSSARSRTDLESLWRIGLVCGLLLTAVLLIRLFVEVFDPVDPVERFLAQARDDYSEFNYPRRWVPAAAVVLILMGGGLRAAWLTGRVGIGTLAAAAASVIGSLIYVTLVTLGNTLPLGPQDPVGTPRDLQFFGNVPALLIPVLAMFSAVLGSIGALFGRALNRPKPV